jgi:hypothetical protein
LNYEIREFLIGNAKGTTLVPRSICVINLTDAVLIFFPYLASGKYKFSCDVFTVSIFKRTACYEFRVVLVIHVLLKYNNHLSTVVRCARYMSTSACDRQTINV